MDKLKLLLWPLATLYGGIISLRNIAYDRGLLASRRFRLPVIAVGNLTVGGTGKTPHVEYLLRLLKNYRVATLSRGYKRSTKGFILADENATAVTIGDEPYQYHKDFPDAQVAVSEKRVTGVEQLLNLDPAPEVIILDDAMQHRAIRPSLNLLITDYNRLFYKDFILPAGLLREPREGAKRADAILVSKCPALMQPSEMESICHRIRTYSSTNTPVFFTGFKYGQPQPMGSTSHVSKHVILLTGIANAEPLKHYLKEHQFRLLHHAAFSDHYMYTIADLENLRHELKKYPADTIILTTRKDAVKLEGNPLQQYIHKLPVFFIPIEVYFLKGGEAFNDMVLQHVKQQV